MKKSTGIFVPNGIGYKEFTDDIETKSVNGISKHLGYNPIQVYSCFGHKNYSEDNVIFSVVFEIFTENILFVATNDTISTLSNDMVDTYLKECDLNKIYRDDVFDIFTNGIEEKCLSIKFLARVLNINDPKSNGRYLIEKFGYYLKFNDGYLTSFESADGLNKWAKEYKTESPESFSRCKRFAQAFLTNSDEITNELNTQAEARVNIPINNDDFQKYALLHRTSYGTINNFNLLICHHGKKVTLDEFLQINKGRYQELNSNSTDRRFKVNHFIYEFSGVDLVNTQQIVKSEEMNNKGFVYVLINPSLKGMVKIGKTQKSPDERATELSSSTGVPTPFYVAYKIYVSDCDQAEKYMHTLLSSKGFRVSSNREFFKIPLDEVIKIMINVKTNFQIKIDEIENESFGSSPESSDFPTNTAPWQDIENLAWDYYSGLGSEIEDHFEALTLFKQAAILGSVTACIHLSKMYTNGEGCVSNSKFSLDWLKKGVSYGSGICYGYMAEYFMAQNHTDNATKCWKKYFLSNDFWLCGEDRDFIEMTYLSLIRENKIRFDLKDMLLSMEKEICEKAYQAMEDSVYDPLKNQREKYFALIHFFEQIKLIK